MRKLTKVEIIDETVEYYNKFPERRGISERTGSCVYQVEENPQQQCALGRCFLAKTRKKLTGRSTCAFALGEGYINKNLKKKYQGHSLGFWLDLQSLHDTVMYWSKDGITEVGRRKAAALKEDYRD